VLVEEFANHNIGVNWDTQVLRSCISQHAEHLRQYTEIFAQIARGRDVMWLSSF
jgi:hypothetical protein